MKLDAAPRVLVSRLDLAAQQSRVNPDLVFCPDCHEAIAWTLAPEEQPTLINGRKSSGWKHTRTGLIDCTPVCDRCHEMPGTREIGLREYDGGGVKRFVVHNYLCDSCLTAYTREHGPVWELV